jgi:hypothetical protein
MEKDSYFQNQHKVSRLRKASATHGVTHVGAAPFALFTRAYLFSHDLRMHFIILKNDYISAFFHSAKERERA